jgi:hypothetical protein
MASRAVSSSRLFASPAGQGFLDLLAPGLYAWGVTVAWPASQRLAPFGSRLLAGAALLSLVASAFLTRYWPAAARTAGLWLFLACSLGAWAMLARSIAPTHLDPVHGVLGSVGWAAFAIVWGGERPAPEEPDAPPAPLRPLPWPDARRKTTLIMALVAVAASIPMALAWWVESTERALLAHAVSLAAGIALVACAADLAAPTPRESAPRLPEARPKRRLAGAAWPLATLVGLALAGALVALLR